MNDRLVVLWTSLGPYHIARIRALKPFFDIRAIELASDQRLYRWWREGPDESTFTLSTGDWEDQNRLLVAGRLWRALSEIRPDILLVPGYSSLTSISAAAWGRLHGAATIVMSESNYEDHERSAFVEMVKRTLVSVLFDGGVAGGKRAAQYLQRLGIPECRIVPGYDVVDNDFFLAHAESIRSDQRGSKSSPYFLYVGRLAPEKNISVLIQAHLQYVNRGGTWPLVIVGDGPLRNELKDQADDLLKRDMIVFAGHKGVNDLPSLYARAGCFVLPSVVEPWGLVVNEAMASGLPVIVSSRCGCADDLVQDGLNGILVDPRNVKEIADALLQMATLSVNDRELMGKHSQAIVSNYSPERWRKEVQRLVEILQKEDGARAA